MEALQAVDHVRIFRDVVVQQLYEAIHEGGSLHQTLVVRVVEALSKTSQNE